MALSPRSERSGASGTSSNGRYYENLGLNLVGGAAGATSSRDAATANAADPILTHPKTGARVFVGDERAAKSEPLLRAKKVSRIVNCQGKRGRNFFENKGSGTFECEYYRFDVAGFHDVDGICDAGDDHEQRADETACALGGNESKAVAFFAPVFAWIDAQLEQGESVLIHCLAGAHRAGCTGVAYMMWWLAKSPENIKGASSAEKFFEQALTHVKQCRPLVDPVGRMMLLLRALAVGILAMPVPPQEKRNVE
eukprot:g2621.t1